MNESRINEWERRRFVVVVFFAREDHILYIIIHKAAEKERLYILYLHERITKRGRGPASLTDAIYLHIYTLTECFSGLVFFLIILAYYLSARARLYECLYI